MAWEVFSFIGTAAFAISGALVAQEEKYDIFGVYILGMVTAFGGGALRNVLLGIPASVLWSQHFLFIVASVLITFIFFFSKMIIPHWNRWGTYFDAIGLAAFAIQGAMLAVDMNMSLYTVMVAAVLTGAGGGVIRDLLAGRRPSYIQRRHLCHLGSRRWIYCRYRIFMHMIGCYTCCSSSSQAFVFFLIIIDGQLPAIINR